MFDKRRRSRLKVRKNFHFEKDTDAEHLAGEPRSPGMAPIVLQDLMVPLTLDIRWAYSDALLASASTTEMFCINSAGTPCLCCKYAGLL